MEAEQHFRSRHRVRIIAADASARLGPQVAWTTSIFHSTPADCDMPISLNRRDALMAGAATFGSSLLGLDLANAQTPSGILRVGMTVGAVPSANGIPDQGGEGARFMGITLFDQLVSWDLSRSDKPAGLMPNLATAWKVDAANPKRWIFTLR